MVILSLSEDYADYNAKDIAEEWVKHSYRNGWSLPAMPLV